MLMVYQGKNMFEIPRSFTGYDNIMSFVFITNILSFICISAFLFGRAKNMEFLYSFQQISKKHLIIGFVSIFIINLGYFFFYYYSTTPIEQLIFHLTLPRTGANYSIIWVLLIDAIIQSLFFGIILIGGLAIHITYNEKTYFNLNAIKSKLLPAFPVISLIVFSYILGIPQYMSNQLNTSTFYEEYYISIEDSNIVFTENKRNLIIIIVESLETGFLSIDEGGAFQNNLIPNITELAKNNVNFSSTNFIGGPVPLTGTDWTIASIVAYYSGIPLVTRLYNDLGDFVESFLPNANGLAYILANQGYNQYFILGSDSRFAGRDKYFSTHKDTVIYDYNYFVNNNYIQEDYFEWWGIEDRKLFDYAKNLLGDISKEEPFFVTILTADTHTTGGYLDEYASVIFDSRYMNVVYDMDKQVTMFLSWIMEQDFYNDTTIIILGDHLYMDNSFFPSSFNEKRYILNIFINSLFDFSVNNRLLSHFDFLPLIIESIGGKFINEGIALGRSLTNETTLIEKYGYEEMSRLLRLRSDFYPQFWQ